MGVFDFLSESDINEGLKKYEAEPSAVLLDAR